MKHPDRTEGPGHPPPRPHCWQERPPSRQGGVTGLGQQAPEPLAPQRGEARLQNGPGLPWKPQAPQWDGEGQRDSRAPSVFPRVVCSLGSPRDDDHPKAVGALGTGNVVSTSHSHHKKPGPSEERLQPGLRCHSREQGHPPKPRESPSQGLDQLESAPRGHRWGRATIKEAQSCSRLQGRDCFKPSVLSKIYTLNLGYLEKALQNQHLILRAGKQRQGVKHLSRLAYIDAGKPKG